MHFNFLNFEFLSMISKELKDILDLAGGRYIIVENGQPKYIVMNFDEYRTAVLERKAVQALTEEELIEKINSDIALWREKQTADDDIALDEIEELEDIEYV
ncbi:MAG: hypothetical protein A3J76_05020 [Candidatus Moranbacteria bacterium RBG_13_45_13]|nr:MAG: hypothetical protein A3J76_05020 [Candidatus Moranbacteria bacterium RBG_13_45_13]